MDRKKPIIVGIGELLWDRLPAGIKVGGAPVNFVYHATQVGGQGHVITAIGPDAEGEEILKELDKKHIDYLVTRDTHPTGSVQVELNEGIPTYLIAERVAWDYLPLSADSIDLAESADAVCFGTLAQRLPVSRETIQTLMSFGKEEAYRVFDMNIREPYYSKELIHDSLKLSNVIKMNLNELDVLRRLFDLGGSEEEIARWIIYTYGHRIVIVTAGSSHSTIYTKDEVSCIPTPRVEVVDKVGAGDAFCGAFITHLLLGKSVAEAHRFAVETAVFVCTKAGAWPEYDK